MQIKIPRDLIKKLDALRQHNHKSKNQMLKEAIMQYLILEKQTQFCLKHPEFYDNEINLAGGI